jgi:hypothetical protein
MPAIPRKLLVGHPSKAPQSASGCAALFGLPFVAGGLFVLLLGAGKLPLDGPEDPKMRQLLMVMGGIFAFAGTLVIQSTISGKIRDARRRRALRDVPLQPWLADYPWDAGGDTVRVGVRSMQGLVGLLFFSAFLAPFNILFIPHPAIVIFDLFALAGWGWFLYLVVQSGKYGNSRLRYAAFPFYLGSQAVLYFDGIDRLKGLRELKVTLRCVEEAIELRQTSKGSQSQTACYCIFEDERSYQPSEISFGEGSPARFLSFARQVDATASLRLELELPKDEKYETCLNRSPARYWELAVKADTPGVDYSATFLVPVYRDPGSAFPAVIPE